MRERIKNSFFGFELSFIPKSGLETTPEEREKEFDRMWDSAASVSGWPTTRTCSSPKESNDLIADYLKPKIRSIVSGPIVAQKLVPKTYP